MAEINLNHKELENVIKSYIKNRIGLYIWGTTGIGKSMTVRRISQEEAEENEREFVEWNELSKDDKHKVMDNPKKFYLLIDKRLSQMDPSDLRGLPNLNGSETVEWKPPMWLNTIAKPEAKGIFFLDEINLAPPSLQASAYQIINDHAMDELSISEDVSIIAAGNRKEDKANVFELPKPLQNRFGHCKLKVPHIDEWIDWAIENDVDDRVIAFLKFKPSLLFKFNPESAEKAFPTPRSWAEFCSKLIKDKPANTNKERKLIKKLASSSVGSGTSTEFTSFLKLRENVDLQDLLKNPEKVENINQLDLKYSIISLVSEWYDKHYKKKDIQKVLQIASHMEDEFAILLLRMAKKKHKSSFKTQIQKLPEWKTIGKRYGKYLV